MVIFVSSLQVFLNVSWVYIKIVTALNLIAGIGGSSKLWWDFITLASLDSEPKDSITSRWIVPCSSNLTCLSLIASESKTSIKVLLITFLFCYESSIFLN